MVKAEEDGRDVIRPDEGLIDSLPDLLVEPNDGFYSGPNVLRGVVLIENPPTHLLHSRLLSLIGAALNFVEANGT